MTDITAAASEASCRHEDLLLRVGQLTRSLHESLRELGLDKIIQRVATGDIPEARDRLLYVARMTEQAAQRVLNAVDAAGPLQENVEHASLSLVSEWRSLDSGTGSVPPLLVERTLAHLESCADAAAQTRGHLLEIMMAQDFQDLTGQVIKKVTELGHSLESQLVQLLIDYAPPEHRRAPANGDKDNGLLNGPQINPQGSVDVVADQAQVDDLLESLGF